MGFLPGHIIALYAICFLINLSIGIFVLSQNPRHPSNRFFFYFTLSHALWITSLFLGYSFIKPYNEAASTFFIRLAYGIPAFMYFLLPAFFYYFPSVRFPISASLRYGLLAFASLCFVLISFTPLVHHQQVLVDGNYVSDTFGPGYAWYIAYLLIAMALGAAFAIHKTFHLHGIERRKIIIALSGALAFLLSAATTNVILPMYGIYFMVQESPALSLLFTIPTFYSMQKHRFFDLSLDSLRIVRALILIVIFVSAIIITDTVLHAQYPFIETIFLCTITGLIALAVFKKTEHLIPEMITSGFREFRDAVEKLKAELYQCNSYTELLQLIESTFVTRLHISGASVLLVRESHGNNIDFPMYVRNAFTSILEKKKHDILILEELRFSSRQEDIRLRDYMEAAAMQVCMPLCLEKTVIGLVSLGKKENRTAYSREEVETLLAFRPILEVCFINILIRSNLQEENNLMKKVIDQKTRSLKMQNKKIKNLLRQQADFIAVTAHEFRTPLNIALLQLEDTLDSYSHASNVREEMRHVETALMRLKNLTQKLFDVQQYDLGKVQLRPQEISADAFLQSIFKEFRDLMDQKQIRFTMKTEIAHDTTFTIDEPQMRQVFHNILTNAFKFTPENGTVALEAFETSTHIFIHIKDSGKGIPDPDDKKRVFEKFQTSKTAMGAGIGLGLYICQKILALHGGTITVADNSPHGADFVISLPK